MGVSGLRLYRKHGVPKFSTEYAQRAIPEPETMEIFLSALLTFSKAYLLALLPLVLNAVRVFVAPVLKVPSPPIPLSLLRSMHGIDCLVFAPL